MRILQVVQKPQRRGAEVFAQQLCQELRSEGHEVRTAYLYPHDVEGALPLAEHDKVLGGREHHYFETIPGVHPLLLQRLKRFIDEMQPDVVQVNGGRTVKYGAAAAVGRRSWILIYRNIGQPGYWIDGWRHQLYSRMIMPRLDGVIGVSGRTLQAVKELYSVSVPTVRIPCAVDPRALVPTIESHFIRRQMTTPLEAPLIVWAGSMTDEKRIDRLIRTTIIVKQSLPNLHLWIVGDGPLRRGLEAEIQASPLAASVRVPGAQKHIANYMNAADVVALTSDTEGMPAVLLEAGLLGKPVVATRVGGVCECVLNGETGMLVGTDDEQGFAAAVASLLKRPDLRSRMGSAAKAWVQQNFTIGRVAPQYAAFYQRVLVG